MRSRDTSWYKLELRSSTVSTLLCIRIVTARARSSFSAVFSSAGAAGFAQRHVRQVRTRVQRHPADVLPESGGRGVELQALRGRQEGGQHVLVGHGAVEPLVAHLVPAAPAVAQIQRDRVVQPPAVPLEVRTAEVVVEELARPRGVGSCAWLSKCAMARSAARATAAPVAEEVQRRWPSVSPPARHMPPKSDLTFRLEHVALRVHCKRALGARVDVDNDQRGAAGGAARAFQPQ
ncbi:uncharacterized protein BcabD6B2_44820 [Babesia caballi]|uniref:Uncharacterized protein n=1 Tax=Babesia caballi TaxID=5871 RepID=A0AAV4LXU3_BABCB|nr:hypothetical protein, conserved [Babesia caballi]